MITMTNLAEIQGTRPWRSVAACSAFVATQRPSAPKPGGLDVDSSTGVSEVESPG